MRENAIDVSEETFDALVLEASAAKPVVVDFWAPWCGPCRVLGPVLERLAAEQIGRFILTKVNVDENPELAADYGIQGIPAVKAFRDGKVVREFVGALPEDQVRSFLAALGPTEADEAVAKGRRLEDEGNMEEAEGLYRSQLERQPRHGGLRLALSKMLVARGEDDEALTLLDAVQGAPEEAEARRIAAEVRLRQGAQSKGEEDYRMRVQADPSDLEARFSLAQLWAAKGLHEEALRELLEILKRDRDFQEGKPRETMLEIFEVVGPRSPLADRYRGEMAKVIFS